MMAEDYAHNVVDEERAPQLKAKWRESLGLSLEAPLDLEIGTGNGYFFGHYSQQHPERNLLGMELKFKPLIQTIKRSLALGNKNSWAVRYHASLLGHIFAAGELNHVFIYFPDPWPKKRHFKNRLITTEFLNSLYALQKAGSILEIKTDHPGYYDWIMERMAQAPYHVTRATRDLHKSEWASENFQTHFEKLWTSKGLNTHLVRAIKN
jgi:tRNA (guanine-N7-)-methyltransferase